MKTRGIKLLDPAGQSGQIDWLLLPATRCPDSRSEERIILAHFRVPHEPWTPKQAFVLPVEVRRSRRRVLFCQRSGQTL